MQHTLESLQVALPALLGGLLLLLFLYKSFHKIGPLEIGLVRLNFSFKSGGMTSECPIAFNGEAGYQAKLLQAGINFRMWPLYSVTRHPWVQIPTDSVGAVLSQIGKSLPQGRKTAEYRAELGDFTDVAKFLGNGGEKGIQRPVLQPGTSVAIHPVAFLVLSTNGVYGVPIDDHLSKSSRRRGEVSLSDFGLDNSGAALKLTRIASCEDEDGNVCDAVGVVTVLDGPALTGGDIACRLGGWADIQKVLDKEQTGRDPVVVASEVVELILASKNNLHSNYEDAQAFFDAGGQLGLQHDLLMPGQYALNPFVMKVEIVPMIEVNQGEVAVVKSYLGLKAIDISGTSFKHGQIVMPGRRGVWKEPLRTGKYPLNPHLYEVRIVPTSILTLNWSKRTGNHGLDENLSAIDARSREGFDFILDVQVQIHVADVDAPRVISAVGSMEDMINEVMRPAVGSFFRMALQSEPAVHFFHEREEVQKAATTFVREELAKYNVEVRGVFIQQVVPPADLIKVFTEREIATQQKQTYAQQREAQGERAAFQKALGIADAQHSLSASAVAVEIAANGAEELKNRADGEAARIRLIGAAEAERVEAIGKAEGAAYTAQKDALGAEAAAFINAAKAIGSGQIKIMPEVLVMGGDGGSMNALAAVLTGAIKNKAPLGLPGASTGNNGQPQQINTPAIPPSDA